MGRRQRDLDRAQGSAESADQTFEARWKHDAPKAYSLPEEAAEIGHEDEGDPITALRSQFFSE